MITLKDLKFKGTSMSKLEAHAHLTNDIDIRVFDNTPNGSYRTYYGIDVIYEHIIIRYQGEDGGLLNDSYINDLMITLQTEDE